MRSPWLLLALIGAAPALAAGTGPTPSRPAASTPRVPDVKERQVAGALLDQAAQSGPRLVTGEWVTYRLYGGPGREAFWRIAVVSDAKDAQGRDARWVEIDFGQHPNMVSPIAQLRALMTDVSGRWEMSRLFIGYGTARPAEVDPSALDLFGGGPAKAAPAAKPPKLSAQLRADVRVVRGAPQRIMTQVGSVLAEPVDVFYRGTPVRRLWTSASVPVLGLVKLELPGLGHLLEVRDHGIGAKPMMVLPPPGTATLFSERSDERLASPDAHDEEPTQ